MEHPLVKLVIFSVFCAWLLLADQSLLQSVLLLPEERLTNLAAAMR
jgi:hypothetical protein